MPGYLALALFPLAGIAIVCGLYRLALFLGAQAALSLRSRAIRVYLGACLGLALMMWLPSLAAFFTGFTLAAQHIAMGVAAGLAALCCLASFLVGKLRHSNAAAIGVIGADPGHPPLAMTLCLVVPFALLSAYLLHTHTIRPDEYGALHVGQSTYGDLSLHLGIATGLRDAAYPPEYTLLPGTLLGYPFLADAMAATMLVLGAGLRESFVLTGLLMMALVFWGFAIFAWRLTQSRRATALAFVLFFLNGGLGFLYMMDGLPSDPSRLLSIFSGFYQTPTNLPDLNLRWVNVICDLMVPQRTLLAGWMMVIPALMLLHEALRTRRRWLFVALGIWAGLMPMVHTHSFLALGLISFGALLHSALFSGRDRRWEMLLDFGLYGLIAVALAAPQLFLWTLPQTIGGGSLSFIFNWVNWDKGRGGLIDGYFWFWIKNVGLVYLVMLPAALHAKKSRSALAFGALAVYVVAELVQFQPNTYDNNKLFTVAFMLMIPLCARYLVDLYDRLRGLAGRRLLAGGFVLVSVLSAGLTIGREVVSDYVLFDEHEAAAARYVDEHAEVDATFAMGTQHNNVIASLAGRKLVCGTPTFLYFHGVDYSEQQQAVKQMLERPGESARLFEAHGVDYVYVSGWERGEYDVDELALGEMFEEWYREGDVVIYRVNG